MGLLEFQNRPSGHTDGVQKSRAVYRDCGILGVRGTQREGVVFRTSRGEPVDDAWNRRQSGLGKDRYLRDAICL